MRETSANETAEDASKSNKDDIKNRGRPLVPGKHRRKPTYYSCGVRCAGGVTLIRAFVGNLRTWGDDAKGKGSSVDPRGRKYRDTPSGADHPVVCCWAVLSSGGLKSLKSK